MASAAGTSTSAVISTLVANLVLCGIFVSCFLILRLKFKRIYSPKSSFDLVPEEKKPEPLPKDPFRWIYILLTKPHSFIIQQAGIDGYFFLRYVIVFLVVFGCGILTWTVLLPINAVDGMGNTGLDQLSISNIKHKDRYYAHVFVSWVFYGGVIFVIYRELFFFNSFRDVVLSSPRYSKKLSSRTVLFQSVPDTLLDEKQFFKMFNGVKRVYVPRNVRKLENKVKERESLALKLEAAESKLLKAAVKAKLKAEKKGTPIEKADDITSYVPVEKRPRHKSGGMFSKKIDTIDYCREKLPQLDAEVKKLQRKHRHNKPKNSIFVEFEDQYHAQWAYQSVVHHSPMRMHPTTIGVEPADILWENLRVFWWERITRRAIAAAFIVALIIFWAIPVAFVGVISNINYLTNKLHFLRFINHMPKQLLGIITGLLPTVLLSLLMSLLPMMIRAMAKVAGCTTVQAVEYYTQTAYFGFLIINGFLVTTISSSASSTITKIIQEPENAMSILAGGLPKASNFYISYLILQGLSVAGGSLFQIVGFFLYYILGYFLDSTLRKKWARFSGLGTMAWGTTFPVFTNLVCITLAYSIISPMIMLFACVAFALVYITYCHNLTYVFVEGPDSRGMHYPRALFQTFTGIYLGQVCMLGIFAVGKGWGPIVLQVIGIISTIFFHLHMNEAFDHLLTVVPVDCMMPLDGVSPTSSFLGQPEYQKKILSRKGRKKTGIPEKELEEEKQEQDEVKQDLLNGDIELNSEETTETIVPLMADRDFKSTQSDNFIIRFIRPDVYLNYRHAKELMPASYNIEPEIVDDKHAFNQPAVSAALPTLWIPKDPMGLSTQLIAEDSKFIQSSDENSTFSEKGKIIFIGTPPY